MPILDCKRPRTPFPQALVEDLDQGLLAARELFASGAFNKAFDLCDELALRHPGRSVAVLAETFDLFRELRSRDRYTRYQSRFFDFPVRPGQSVLDVGSGHPPFPLATHLGDTSRTGSAKGRAGRPARFVDGKPVSEFAIESIPFPDKGFDFVYCSHVLEHAEDPERACRELMRIGRGGYVEALTHGKDVFLNSAKLSNPRYSAELLDGVLVFTPCDGARPRGLGHDILRDMHVAPQTDREKAFAALISLRADRVNTMFIWQDDFPFEVLRPKTRLFLAGEGAAERERQAPALAGSRPLRLLQVHTFYQEYLDGFYQSNPGLAELSHQTQTAALLDHGFSAIHMLTRALPPLGYQTGFIVANCQQAQNAWAKERGMTPGPGWEGQMELLVRQIDDFAPDVLYLTDPLNLHRFLEGRLARKPPLTLGWRAANVPESTDWKAFDVMLSNLPGMREAAVRLGAGCGEAFYPGFPWEYYERTRHIEPSEDLVFVGGVNIRQYPRRIPYLERLAAAAERGDFSFRLHLSGDLNSVSRTLAGMSRPAVFGLDMYKALRRGRIAFDARGAISLTDKDQNQVLDLAGRNTSNMRIFEATGLGRFLLTEHYDNLEGLFDIGREIVTYQSPEELLDKIRYYLAHPAEREAIAERGRLRCHREHNIEARCRDFDRIVRRHLGRTAGAPRREVEP